MENENNTDNSVVSPIQMVDIGKDLTPITEDSILDIAEQAKASSVIVVTASVGEPIPVNIVTYKLNNPQIVMSVIMALEEWLEDNKPE